MRYIIKCIVFCSFISYLKAQNHGDFYFKTLRNAQLNNEGKVLVHTSEQDSFYLFPLQIDTLGIDLDEDNYAIFDESIRQFLNLKCLWLRFACVKKLPASICNLSKLEFLDLQHSCFEALPEDFGNLKSLKTLILLYSPIEKLPNSFIKLENLEFLNLVNTRLTQLPNGIENLKKLNECHISYYQNELKPSRIDKRKAKKLEKNVKNLQKKVGKNRLPYIVLT